VSQDPKKPFDAPPAQTPELLQREIPLDRRNRRVPTFEELRAQAPTDPERPAHPRPHAAPTERVPRPQAIPQATIPASPRALEGPPTAPMPRPPQAAPARPAAPAAPARPVAPPPNQPRPAAAPAPIPERTNVLPPRTASSEEAVRTLPPSPSDWARLRGQPAPGPLPLVTPGIPVQGASIPPGQSNTPNRAQPAHHAPPPTRPMPEPAPEPTTLPHQRPVPRPPASPQRPASASFQSLPSALPPEMLVTQPGTPGPFANKDRARIQAMATPESLPPLPAPDSAPAPSSPRAPSLADFAALAEPKSYRGDVIATPASLWRRLAAWLVDMSLLAAVVTAMLLGAAQVIAGGLTVERLPAILLPATLLAALLSFVYASLFAFVWGGRSPGRRVLGLHLVDGTGHPPSPARALFRGVLSLASFALFLSGFWMALFDRRGQTLHDKLSSTFVVRLHDA
jgi:uncharacterized RDD family membrane protein YckC